MKLRRIPQNGRNGQRPFVLHSVNTEILSEKILDSRSQLSRPMKGEHEQPEGHDDQVGPAAELIRNELG